MNIRCRKISGARWRGAVAAAVVAFAVAAVPAPVWAQGNAADTGTPSGVAMQAAAWLASVPYGAAKLVYAITGGVIGGVTYVLSGGNRQAADAVWVPSIYGNYIITPAQLRGQEPIHFVGSQTPPAPPAASETPPAAGGAQQAPSGSSTYPMQSPNEPPAE